jgi:diaminopimelate epimerase
MNETLPIAKYQALGNDFLVVDARDNPSIVDDQRLAFDILDRHFGAGADDLIFLTRSSVADAGMRIRTPSGGWLSMCGNGIRCLAQFIWDAGISDARRLRIETDTGIRQTHRLGDGLIEADLLEPDLSATAIPTTLAPAGEPVLNEDLPGIESVKLSCVSVGNPHAIVFVDDLDAFGDQLLPEIATHAAFPEGVNAHAAQIIAPDRVRIRTWERGAGWTLA